MPDSHEAGRLSAGHHPAGRVVYLRFIHHAPAGHAGGMTLIADHKEVTVKIAMVSEHSDPSACVGDVDAGGQNVHVAALAQALAAKGHSITIYTRRDSPHSPDRQPLSPGVVVERIPAGEPKRIPKNELLPCMALFAEHLSARWTSWKPDVVHSHYWMSGMAALSAAGGGLPVVHTYHSLGTVKRRHLGPEDTSPMERMPAEKAIGTSAARIIATCPSELRELIAMGVEQQRIEVIPCGVDLQRFTPQGVGAHAERRWRYRVLTVGRLVRHKGIELLLQAMPELPDVELMIAGGPRLPDLLQDPEARRLYQMADRLGVGDRVTFLGQVSRNDMPAWMRSADIVACTPWFEPFGMVALEAMACGTPVLVTAVGGLADTIEHGVNGVKVLPRDAASLVHGLRRLLDDASLRQTLASAALVRVRAQYGWHRIADETEHVYRGTMQPAQESGHGEKLPSMGFVSRGPGITTAPASPSDRRSCR